MKRTFGSSPKAWTALTAAFLFLFVGGPRGLPAAEPTPAQLQFFESRVRPVFSQSCHKCHSHKARKLKGKLYLDSRSGVLKGGETAPAVVPGNPGKSLLVTAIGYRDVDLQMPPKKKLPAAVIADLTKWVDMGAPWPQESAPVPRAEANEFDYAKRLAEHWCWQPIRDRRPPPTRKRGWATTEVDRFILARLEAKGLTPAGDADRRTWIRRVTYDLIGLPPRRKEVQAFVQDRSPRAYEKVVDRLLASEHFGERWARHWMDLVRYAESYGHEFDYPLRHASVYRDYLIRAFNANVPYDRLITEHIAGDLIANPRLHPAQKFNESIIGTGFWFFGEATHAPTDVRGDEADHIDNQLDVMSKTFLGISLTCARCHDHKFDPIRQSDYYAAAGFLQSSRRQEAMLDPEGKIAAAARQLRDLKAQGDRILTGAGKSALSAERFARTLLATYDAIHGKKGTPKPPTSDASAKAKDLVFEDFEGGTYAGWKVEGTAFGKAPARGTLPGQMNVPGFAGRGLVNTFYRGDGTTGTLTSKTFKISHRYVHFLIGGGRHKNQTCIQLRVGGKVVQSTAGRNNERLSPAAWDMIRYVGKSAEIRIVDTHRGGWGHINIDHIVFSDKPGVARPDQGAPGKPVVDEATLAAAARAHRVSAETLHSWVDVLAGGDIAGDTAHPLHAWSVLSRESNAAAFSRKRRDLARRLQDLAAAPADDKGRAYPIAGRNGPLNGWFVTGEAFKSGVTGVEWDPTLPGSQLAQPGLAHGGLYGTRLQGTLRSPTFTLTEPEVHIRIRGRGVAIRLIIDGYQMQPFNGLLFGGTHQKKVDTRGKFQWIRLGNNLYKGNSAYLEIIDHGDGFAVVDRLVVGKRGGGGKRPDAQWSRMLSARTIANRAALAKAFGRWWSDAKARERKGTASVGDLHLLRWASSLTSGASPKMSEIRRRMQDINKKIPSPKYAFAMSDGTSEDERIHIRGSHKILGAVAPRRLASAVGGSRQSPITQGSGRLDLARRIADANNPLTARVMVNRIWHHMFGRGIVPTTNNFGRMGQRPSHPELLDWLARDFTAHDWSIKHTIRTLALSHTYRMSSKPPEKRARVDAADPDNRYLHRMPIRRLQAEAIRDGILTVSGRLDRKLYGGSVPVHLTSFQGGRGRPKSGPIDGQGRRSLYLATKRNFLSSMMLTFDFPIPFTSVGRRNVSNVPAQALVLMNNPFVVGEAKRWGQQVARRSGSVRGKITVMFETALAHPPSDRQLVRIEKFVREQAGQHGGKTAVPAIWADVAHMLFNMKSFIFVN